MISFLPSLLTLYLGIPWRCTNYTVVVPWDSGSSVPEVQRLVVCQWTGTPHLEESLLKE